jgi:hypothetical protein
MPELLQAIVLGSILLAMIIALPASIVVHFRQSRDGKNRGKAGTAVGNALQDLDRLVARPSIEYRIEAENYTQKACDDQGGD